MSKHESVREAIAPDLSFQVLNGSLILAVSCIINTWKIEYLEV